MQISGVTDRDLSRAIDKVNETFDGNVTFNRLDTLNAKETRFAVTLKVKSSKGKGARLGQHVNNNGTRRHLIYACWHAHGTFFDALPASATIRTGDQTIRPGDAWADRNIGSYVYPLMYSEACECD